MANNRQEFKNEVRSFMSYFINNYLKQYANQNFDLPNKINNVINKTRETDSSCVDIMENVKALMAWSSEKSSYKFNTYFFTNYHNVFCEKTKKFIDQYKTSDLENFDTVAKRVSDLEAERFPKLEEYFEDKIVSERATCKKRSKL